MHKEIEKEKRKKSKVTARKGGKLQKLRKAEKIPLKGEKREKMKERVRKRESPLTPRVFTGLFCLVRLLKGSP